MNNKKLLLIESNEDLRELLKLELTYKGYQVDLISLNNFNNLLSNPDVIEEYFGIIIDTDLSYALNITQTIRNLNTLIWIIVCVPSSIALKDKISLYNEKADECLVRGFHVEELASKLMMFRRRSANDQSESVLEYSDLRLNLITRIASRGDLEIELRSKEFDLLNIFMKNPEQILSRQYIFNHVWGFDFLGDSNVIEVYVRYLRLKLGKPHLIKTRRGKGYILISEEAQIKQASIEDNYS